MLFVRYSMEELLMNCNERAYSILMAADNGLTISTTDREFLSECREINWSFSTMVTKIPTHISLLTNLQSLDLTGLGLVSLPDELCLLNNLKTLVLRGNNLKSLPDAFKNLRNLTVLDLSRNNWAEFPNQIQEITGLTYLNLSYCSFPHLPGWLLELNIDYVFEDSSRGIILEKTSAPEIAILNKPRATILRYYTNLSEGGQIVREAKVVLLGDGDAGKTYTVDRIEADGERLNDNHIPDQTKGISIIHKDFDYNGQSVTVNFWDFGGQQIMHAMHRCFLTGNTLYVIVLSGRAEVMERRLHYWMTTLNSFVSTDCPVVVLENLFDVRNEAHIDTVRIRRLYKNIVDVFSINVKNASKDEFIQFVDKLLHVAVTHTHYGARVPKHWADVKTLLEKSEKPYLSRDDFTRELEAISPKTRGDELEILDWLNELGTSFSCHRAPYYIILHEYVVLNPEWATNAIYAIINSANNVSESNGILGLTDIEAILEGSKFVNSGKYDDFSYTPGNVAYILELMENYYISFPLRNALANSAKEFIPSLCQNKEPHGIEDYLLRSDLRFEIHYSYLPSNLLHWFMINNFTDLEKENKWWYSGGIFVSDEYKCSALIMREIAQNEDDRITICIRNQHVRDEAWRYLERIRKQLDAIGKKMNISPTGSYVYYSEQGISLSERIQLDKIKEHIAIGWTMYQSTVFKKEIPIADILRIISPIGDAATLNNLLSIIVSGCSYMQKRSWLPKEEDARNDYLCDLLRSAQVFVLDQSRSGTANVASGELDFLFQDIRGNTISDYAIMEAMNLKSIDEAYIQKHITKLIDDNHYNANGLKQLYLLVYADIDEFQDFCDRYLRFAHIASYPSNVVSFTKVNYSRQRNIAVWKVSFEDGTILYHIVVKIPPNSHRA